MLGQNNQQKIEASELIEFWMKGELAPTVRYFLRKYGATFERKLGLAKEDLENEIRLEVWKGLLSYNKSKSKMKTYMNRLIKNRVLTLYSRSELGKNNMIDYFADVFATERVSEEDKMTFDNAEAILERRETMMEGLLGLDNDLEFNIVRDLISGENLATMERKYKVTRVELVAVIVKIDKLVRGEEEHGEAA